MSSTTTTLNDDSRDTSTFWGKRPYPPGPKSKFFGVESYLASQRDPLRFMERLAREYGDIVHFKIGQRHVYLLNHPDYIKDVLVSHYTNFLKGRGIVRRDNFLGEGLVTSEGSFHRRQRRLTQPAFNHERFAGYGAVMAKMAADISQSWRAGESLDVLEAMRRITLPIASQTLFGTKVDTEHERIIAAFRTGLSRFRSFKPATTRIFDRLSLTQRWRVNQARFQLETLISQIIAERRSEEGDRGDLLSLLLSRTGTEGEQFTSDRQIRDEAVTLFIAGFENIATALTWTWYLLGKHPDVQQKLHEELDNVLGERLPTAADLPRLGYTRMVLEESMRIYPPVPRLVRTALRNYQIGGYTVPPGALVVVSQYLIQRDSRYYQAPERFDPERWTPANRAAHPAYSYFPFGGGPRGCIGEGFAYMEGILVLATLASRWRLLPTSPAPVELTATHFLHPKGSLAMRAERRAA
jgi:cytochrome P450